MAPLVRLLAFFAAWLAASLLFAQVDALGVVPKEALGFAVINRLGDTSARVNKLTQTMRLEVPDLLTTSAEYTNATAGIDETGPLIVAAFAPQRGSADLRLAAFVPVQDYEAFLQPLLSTNPSGPIRDVTLMKKRWLCAQRGAFAVIVPLDQKSLLEEVLAARENVLGEIEPLRSWLDAQQAAIVVTPRGMPALIDETKTLIDAAAQAIDATAADARVFADTALVIDQFSAFKATISAARVLLESAAREFTHFAAGLDVDPQSALRLSARALTRPGGDLTAWARSLETLPAGPLTGLPPTKFIAIYALATANFQAEFRTALDQADEVLFQSLSLDQNQRQAYSAAARELTANRLSVRSVLGQLRPGDAVTSTTLLVESVKDAAAHLRSTRRAIEVLSPAAKAPGGPVYSVTDTRVGQLDALEIAIDMGALVKRGADPNVHAAFTEYMSRMFGPDGVSRAYVAAADEHTVVTAYSKELLQRSFEHVRSGAAGLEADSTIVAANRMLPPAPQFAVYVSLPGLMQMIDSLARDMLQGELAVSIPPFPLCEPIGAAVFVGPDGLQAALALPASVTAGIGKYLKTIEEMVDRGELRVP